MANNNKIYQLGLLVLSIILLEGCTSITNKQLLKKGSTITPITKSTSQLRSLPEPMSKISAAVYQFRDQTGQYKEKDAGSSFSTAVTQGATPILMKALQDSGWFVTVEREGLQNLLTERKIVRSSVKSSGQNKTPTTSLKPARILLEGGITGFDSNIRTGGEGAEYFGVSASRRYREDYVTVHLRAVDIETGQVLASVSTSKRLLSLEYRTGLFRYIKYKKLLGIEAGYTQTEPSHLCVADAIEKAVHDLVLEGVEKQIWKFKDPSAVGSDTAQAYQQEKQALYSKSRW